MKMNLPTEWLSSKILGTVLIVANKGILAVLAQHLEEAEAQAEGMVLAAAIEVVGMAVVVLGMAVVVLGREVVVLGREVVVPSMLPRLI